MELVGEWMYPHYFMDQNIGRIKLRESTEAAELFLRAIAGYRGIYHFRNQSA
jgi:hypothetical protein